VCWVPHVAELKCKRKKKWGDGNAEVPENLNLRRRSNAAWASWRECILIKSRDPGKSRIIRPTQWQ